jgi:putative two-component system response regulator
MLTRDLESLDAWLATARVLLIDDQPANLTFLRHVLEPEGYGQLTLMSDSIDAIDRFSELDPDVIIVDLWMPGLDGFDFIARVEALLPEGSYLPILVATGDHTPEARRRALSAGARDFLTKPLSPAEVRLRVRNLLETRFLHEQLRCHNALLEQRVAERTHELEEARLEMLYRLARAAEFRDDESGQHTLRVGRIAGRIAQVLGLADEEHELIARAAPLHDIGKIGVPDAVLLKRGQLDAQERVIIERHAVIGADILSGSRYSLLQLAEEIALCHHERWDGRGYPRGLARDEIPISGRVVAVADVFDALTHDRPYKRAWTVRDALAEIEANAGTQFDPDVVEALLRVAPEAGLLAAETRDTRAEPLTPSMIAALVASAAGAGPGADPAADAPAHAGAAPHGVPTVDAGVVAALHRSEQTRDALEHEVRLLRRQLARHEAHVVRVGRWTQPN